MSKQVYIDENGNEVLVSGTVNTADMMPMSGNDSTKVSEAIGDLSQLTTSVQSSLVGAVNEVNGKLTVTSGTVTWNTTNVTGGTTIKQWVKYGRVVTAHLEFTPLSGKIANGNVICSDLPIPYTTVNCFGDNKQQFLVDGVGQLKFYFPTDTTTLNRWDLNISYISAS